MNFEIFKKATLELSIYNDVDHDLYKKLGFKQIEFHVGGVVLGMYIPNQWVNIKGEVYNDVLNGSMMYVQLISGFNNILNSEICNNFIELVDAKFKLVNLYKDSQIIDHGIRKFSSIYVCSVDYKTTILNYKYHIRQVIYPLGKINIFMFIKIPHDENNYLEILNFICNSLFISRFE